MWDMCTYGNIFNWYVSRKYRLSPSKALSNHFYQVVFIIFSSYNQYVFGVASVLILFSYIFFRLWFRAFFLHKYKFSIEGIASIFSFWCLSILFGVTGYYIFKTNPTILITTAVFICPTLVSGISFFRNFLLFFSQMEN